MIQANKLVGCLIKGPLGCGAFLFGASIVSIFLLPNACGRLASEELEESFAKAFAGRLEVGEASLLSAFERQKINDLKLLDPSGDQVLHGPGRAQHQVVAVGEHGQVLATGRQQREEFFSERGVDAGQHSPTCGCRRPRGLNARYPDTPVPR